MDEKAMEREERIASFLIKIGNWWERLLTIISNFIFVELLRRDDPRKVAEQVSAEVQKWNEKYAGHCEICGHGELRTLFWLNDSVQGIKCFECTRCHHMQETHNDKMACLELLKKRICIKANSQPRYELITAKEAIIISLIGLALCIWWISQLPPSTAK